MKIKISKRSSNNKLLNIKVNKKKKKNFTPNIININSLSGHRNIKNFIFNNNKLISNNNSIKENNNNINIKWKDPMHEELINNLPLSFLKLTENNFLWLSPEEYILNEKIDEDIKKVYPKRNYVKMREDIKDFYKVVKEKEKQEKEKQEKLEQERIEKEKMEKEKIDKENIKIMERSIYFI